MCLCSPRVIIASKRSYDINLKMCDGCVCVRCARLFIGKPREYASGGGSGSDGFVKYLMKMSYDADVADES